MLRDVFVGREDELARLGAALEAACQGQGRLVTLVGDPGIGKTRTARQLTSLATSRGAEVLWARCHEEGGAPPYWVWVQVVRAHARAADPVELRRDLGPGAPDVAEVVPDLRGVLPDLEVSPSLDLDRSRYRFFDSVAGFLRRAGARRPLVLILDNLHWADEPSLLLLEFLAPELATSRLLVVATYREAEVSRRHPLARTRIELMKEPHYDEIALRGLPSPQVGAFLAAQTGVVPPRSLVEALWRQTEGNPLFLTQLVRLLDQDGALTPRRLDVDVVGLTARIPTGVSEVIGRRLDRLPADCRRVLQIGSVIGREFPLEVLQNLMPDAEDGPIQDGLETAIGSGLIEYLPDPSECYRFTHVLVQRTLSDELASGERLALHGRIAEELERRYGDAAEEHAAELAYHLGEAARSRRFADAAKLVTYCRLAGEQAVRVHGYEEAVTHFQRALAARPPGPVDAEMAAILFGLGRAQAATLPLARMREAVATLRRAADHFVATGDVARAIETALLPYYPVLGEPTGQGELILRVLTLVPDESKEAALLLSRYGLLLAREDADVVAARAAWQRALAIAGRGGDPALWFRVLANAAHTDLLENPSAEWLPRIDRALELPVDRRDPQVELLARYNAAQVSFCFADVAGVARFGFPMLPLAEKLRDRAWLSSAHRVRAHAHWLRGDFDAARAESDLSLAVAPENPRDLAIRIQLEFETGNAGAGEGYLDRLIRRVEAGPPVANDEHTQAAWVIPLVARLAGSPERLSLAERAARIVLAKRTRTWGSVAPYYGLALAAIVRGDRNGAREPYQALAADEHPLLVFCTVCRDRLLGLLARTMGDDVHARRHFADALRLCAAKDLRPELAWTSYDFADFLTFSSNPDDRARGAELLDQARVISERLGMRLLARRAEELAERLPPREATPQAYPDGLTQREAQVLRLLATGKPDRAIAEELSISIRTVGKHVSSVLEKTATANRTEATAYAFRHGLA